MIDQTQREQRAIETSGRSGTERRRSRRFLCDGFAEVHLLARDTMFRGEICDLSLHGCFVATRARVHVETKNAIALRVALRNQTFSTEGIVANIRPGVGVGVEFQHPSAQIEKDFRALVADIENGTPVPLQH